MRKQYQLEESEWAKLMQLSREAHNTPVMALSVADGLAGRDFASMARERVFDYWRELGRKYKFDSDSVQPVDGRPRIISAEEINA